MRLTACTLNVAQAPFHVSPEKGHSSGDAQRCVRAHKAYAAQGNCVLLNCIEAAEESVWVVINHATPGMTFEAQERSKRKQQRIPGQTPFLELSV